MENTIDKYVERLQTMSDSALRREWDEESGERRRQIEHEMVKRFRKPVLLQQNHLNKFLDLPEQFMAAYREKNWFLAKYIYDLALKVGLFLEIPATLRNQVFGISAENENEIRGMFPRDLVSQVDLECVVKDNLGFDCVVYRIPGEIGFYGARPAPGTRHMKAEENPASWAIREEPVAM